MEVRSRSPSAHHLLIMPEAYKERYRDLERYFSAFDGKISDVGEIQGTLEELLLACAVSRYGIWSWDSVAMKVWSWSPSAHHLLLTLEGYEEWYRDLERRFSTFDGKIGGRDGGLGLEISWLEELWKFHVVELQRSGGRWRSSSSHVP
ncbi:hypothetical protein COCNU_contig69249090G000010 [Cocos nucifera]|nr:hypothetical protein [Cocos nucifera]